MRLVRDFLIALKEVTLEYLKSRIFPVTVIIILLFCSLVGRLFKLQIKQGNQYTETIDVRSEKTIQVNSIRGNIYDVNGKLLAYNEIAYTLTYGNDTSLPEEAEKMGISNDELRNRVIKNTLDILHKNGDDIDISFSIKYSGGNYSYRISGTQLKHFLKDIYALNSIDELTEEQLNTTPEQAVAYLNEQFGISNEYDRETAYQILVCRYNLWMNRFKQYVNVEIAHNISEASRSSIVEAKDMLLGMDILVTSIRKYNDAEYFAHIIGYVGKASQDDIEYFNSLNTGNTYDGEDYVGKDGVERVYEAELHGTDGTQTMYVDNLGKVLEVKESTPALAGNDVYLSIDSDLQKYCYDMLEQEIANIIITHLVDVAYAPDTNSQHDIPITDIYAAFFNNNRFSMDHMKGYEASDLEKRVYASFLEHQKSTLESMDELLTTNNAPLSDLSNEYRDYCEYVCEMLSEDDLYDFGKVDPFAEEYQRYINHEMSLQDYLKYCINIEAIDVKNLKDISEYNDNEDVYLIIRDYIIKHLRDNENFNHRILTNMIRQGEISGDDIINLIYDQGILKRAGDLEYESFINGGMTTYSYFVAKLKNGDITPAMLNLEPCSGSVVVTDVNTGEVRALVSYPSYDNNYLTNYVDPDYYADLQSNGTSPLLNRSCNMLTPPGSTFKIVSTVAGVNEGVLGIDEFIADMGVFKKAWTEPECWIHRDYNTTHGVINIPAAIDVSCNYFFYEVGYRLATESGSYNDTAGLRRLNKYAAEFGLGEKSGLELYETSPNLSDRDSVLSCIGQGTNLYTPVQLSKYATGIANNGKVYNLSILSRITDFNGNTIKETPKTVYSHVEGPPEMWDQIRWGMRLVVTDDLQDDNMLNGINVDVAGKTGTAQVGDEHAANALFISYAPYETPEVSVSVIIPNGYTSRNAGQLAGFIYAYMYDKEALVNATFEQNKSSAGD